MNVVVCEIKDAIDKLISDFEHQIGIRPNNIVISIDWFGVLDYQYMIRYDDEMLPYIRDIDIPVTVDHCRREYIAIGISNRQ